MTQLIPGQKRQPMGAFDSIHKVFLLVHGNGDLGGQFLNESGTPENVGFAISPSSQWMQSPSVRYSAEEDAFLVVWYDSRASGFQLWGRLLRYGAGGSPVFLTPEFNFFESGKTRATAPAGMVYFSSNREFIVVWQAYLPDGSTAIEGQRIKWDGTRVGGNFLVATDGNWHDEASIACNPATSDCMVEYAYYSDSARQGQVRLQRISATGALIGGPVIVTTASVGASLTQISYNPVRSQYLAVWSTTGYFAAYFNSDGAAASAGVQIAPGYSGYNGMSYAFNPVSRTYLLALQSNSSTDDDIVEFNLDLNQGPVVPVIKASGIGNYDPQVTSSNSRGEWLVAASNAFATIFTRIVRASN